MVTLEDATINSKNYLAKMKGLDIDFSGRPIIDYLDFTVLKSEETTENYILSVDFISGMFSAMRSRFKLKIDKKTGIVKEVERIIEK